MTDQPPAEPIRRPGRQLRVPAILRHRVRRIRRHTISVVRRGPASFTAVLLLWVVGRAAVAKVRVDNEELLEGYEMSVG